MNIEVVGRVSRTSKSVVLRAHSDTDFKSREHLVIERNGGRWTGRHRGYACTPGQASRILREVFIRALSEGGAS